MKAKMFLSVFLGILSCTFCAFAQAKPSNASYGNKIEKSDVHQKSRVYVTHEQIYVNCEGIFVEVKGDLYQVSQICEDENGIFVPHVGFWWRCPNNHPNPPWRIACQVCGMGPA